MKKKFTKIAAVALAAMTAFGMTAYAASNSRNIDIYYRNIKLMIDGAEFIAKDVNGNKVEPFIYDGTTYLPVRGIANAFGKDVVWDGENATIYIGKKGMNAPDNRLDKLYYTDYREENRYSNMSIINGNVTDVNGNDYTNGLLFELNEGAESAVDYALNGQYKKLTGTIVLPKRVDTTSKSDDDLGRSETTVVILGEDEDELFRINGVTESMPYKFEVNVKNVNKITIKVSSQYRGQWKRSWVALTDLALYK